MRSKETQKMQPIYSFFTYLCNFSHLQLPGRNCYNSMLVHSELGHNGVGSPYLNSLPEALRRRRRRRRSSISQRNRRKLKVFSKLTTIHPFLFCINIHNRQESSSRNSKEIPSATIKPLQVHLTSPANCDTKMSYYFYKTYVPSSYDLLRLLLPCPLPSGCWSLPSLAIGLGQRRNRIPGVFI